MAFLRISRLEIICRVGFRSGAGEEAIAVFLQKEKDVRCGFCRAGAQQVSAGHLHEMGSIP